MIKTKYLLLGIIVLGLLYLASWFFNHVSPWAGLSVVIALAIAIYAYIERNKSVNDFKNKRNEKK